VAIDGTALPFKLLQQRLGTLEVETSALGEGVSF
jgi:hypothetical protein